MELNEQQKSLLTELASMSANWNDTLYFQKLESKYKLVIQELIEQSGIEKGDIHFGVQNEWVLKILKNTNWCLINVITPTDGVWRNYLNKEWEKVEENVWETLDETEYYTLADLNELSQWLGRRIVYFLENWLNFTDEHYVTAFWIIEEILAWIDINISDIILKDWEKLEYKIKLISELRDFPDRFW